MSTFADRMYSDYEKSQCFYVVRGKRAHCIVCEAHGYTWCTYLNHVQRKYEETYNKVMPLNAISGIVSNIVISGDQRAFNESPFIRSVYSRNVHF